MKTFLRALGCLLGRHTYGPVERAYFFQEDFDAQFCTNCRKIKDKISFGVFTGWWA